MNRLLLCLLLAGAAFSTGCPQNAPKLNLSKDAHRELLIGQLKTNVYKVEWARYKCASEGHHVIGLNDQSTGFSVFSCTPITQSVERAKTIRNEVLDNGVGLIDDAYGVYIRNIRKNRSVGEFLADLLQIGGSVAGGVTKGERPLQIIGVALTGYSAVRKSANLNFYDEKTTNVLIKQMDASRSKILFEIKQSQAKPLEEYSFDAALDDIIRYFDVGTLNRAFTELDKQTSLEAEIARRGVLNIKKIQPLLKQEEAAIIATVDDKLTTLHAKISSTNNQVAASAGTALKSIYDKIKAESKFNTLISELTNIANGQAQDPRSTPDRIRDLKSAFDKVARNEVLTGKDYYTLVSEICAKAFLSPELNGLMEKYFSEIAR